MVAASVVFLRYGLTGAAVCGIAACVRGRRRLATTGFFRCACVIRYHLLHLPVDNILATLSFRVNEGVKRPLVLDVAYSARSRMVAASCAGA